MRKYARSVCGPGRMPYSAPKTSAQRMSMASTPALSEVEFLAPSNHPDKKALTLRVLHILETSPPLDDAPLEWFLLTACEITTTEQAQECLRWDCLRWRIEDWHRVLKRGCRTMSMTLLGRACTELPAELLFSDAEIKVLQADAKKRIEKPTRLAHAVRLVARLGGYIGPRVQPVLAAPVLMNFSSNWPCPLVVASAVTAPATPFTATPHKPNRPVSPRLGAGLAKPRQPAFPSSRPWPGTAIRAAPARTERWLTRPVQGLKRLRLRLFQGAQLVKQTFTGRRRLSQQTVNAGDRPNFSGPLKKLKLNMARRFIGCGDSCDARARGRSFGPAGDHL